MRVAPLLFLAACASPTPPAPPASATGVAVTTRVAVDARGTRSLVVQIAAPASTPWTATSPATEGLTFVGPTERVERLGDRSVTTRTWTFRGGKGSYVIEGLCATPAGADGPTCALPLYLDIDAEPDRTGMVDITEPPALWPLPPPWLTASALALALAGLGAWRTLRPREAPVVTALAEERPDLAALRRWEAIRRDTSLSAHDKALGLSEVFRTYAEAVLLFPARSFTTTETLAHLRTLAALPRENLPRARKLLTATDRVKYAEARPNDDFFEELDADLRGFIDSTRPKTWEGA